MFWVFLLSVFGSAAVYVNRERHRELIPYVVATISTVQMFFLYLMVVHNNPFTTYLSGPRADARTAGLCPKAHLCLRSPPTRSGYYERETTSAD